jgi:predicted  nucleic acid-binding Zn-ribbon protein
MSKTPLTDKNRGTVNMHFVFYINPENGELVKAEFAEQLERELTTLTEQRDRLAEQIEANHKGTLMLEQMVYDAREQRDRMAVLLSDIQDYTKGVKRYDYSKLTLYERMQALHDDWQEIECRIEQLLQTTPTQPEPK